jgi:ketosteroid isomerase-like protein
MKPGQLGRILCSVAAIVATGVALAQAPQVEERKQDHDALRALLVKSAQALNARNLDSMAGALHPGFTVITVDNQKIVGLDAFKKYYASLFDGPNAVLTKLDAKPVADELTRFVDDTTGLVYGVSDDAYVFKDGETRTMKTRWSAVVAKDGDAWKLVNVHFSANAFDNPMLDAAKAYVQKIAIIAGVVGLVVGALLMALLRRRPRT